MSCFDEEVLEHGGADCRECPAYAYCEIVTEQMSEGCRGTLNQMTPREATDE